ncbi:MAG TPA: hypothetical protein DEQ09_07910 [Bacteroidales bacterium]|nr:hypothetical protein [Bacteroidales bacterium]
MQEWIDTVYKVKVEASSFVPGPRDFRGRGRLKTEGLRIYRFGLYDRFIMRIGFLRHVDNNNRNNI